MRFSAAFTLPLPLVVRTAQPDAPGRADAAAPLTDASIPVRAAGETLRPDLPDDLDARVRLIGEWQLGEAD
jgi:hypothetical protein